MLDLFGAMIHWFFFGCSFGWWQFRNHVNDRAVIFVRQGPFIDHVLAVRRDVTKDGQIFQYGNGKHAVIVKPTDPLCFWEHERMLGVVDGEAIATAFDKADQPERKFEQVKLLRIPVVDITLTHKVEVKPEEVVPDPVLPRTDIVEGSGRQQDETLISNVIDGHLATELAESPTAPGKGGWGFKELRWVLLIGLALIIVFVVYKFVLHGHLPFLQSAAGNSTITPTPGPGLSPTITPHFSGLIIQIRSVIGV
jgi:hypothetical protein